MPDGIEIRRFDTTEADLLRQVRLAALQDSPEAFGSTFEVENAKPPEFWATWLAQTPTFGPFTRDGAPAGMAAFIRATAPKQLHRGSLGAMYVAPAWRGTDAATRLVDAVLDHARHVVTQVHLSAVAGNPRAVRFYRRMGFVEYGREPSGLRHAGIDHDVLLMVRKLHSHSQ